jgi:hypothetical protein
MVRFVVVVLESLLCLTQVSLSDFSHRHSHTLT